MGDGPPGQGRGVWWGGRQPSWWRCNGQTGSREGRWRARGCVPLVPALGRGLRLVLAVWIDEAVKIVLLGVAELAWESGSRNGNGEKPGGIWATGGLWH